MRRIGEEHRSRQVISGEETKGDFERIFHDSGIEFAHFDAKESNGTQQKVNDDELGSRSNDSDLDGDPMIIN